MKKKIKVMLMVLGLFGAFCTGVYAQSYLESISAYLNKGITLSWNGVPFYPTEDDGTRVYPITYNGRTYIPAKFIAEKAGLNVEWQENTLTVAISDSSYVPQTTVPEVKKGTYTKVGNGQVRIIPAGYESVVEYGFDVKETFAETANGEHIIEISYPSLSYYEQVNLYKTYLDEIKKGMENQGLKAKSEIPLGDGHYKYIFSDSVNEVVFYSTNNMVCMVATNVKNSPTNYFPKYFSSVPKPNLDSTWEEKITSEYTDWSVNNNNTYAFGTSFKNADKRKVTNTFEEYKELLQNNGFTFYKMIGSDYVYIKNDISVTLDVDDELISVILYSGSQAVHNLW